MYTNEMIVYKRTNDLTGLTSMTFKADVQSVEFSERVKILLFRRESVALKLNRQLRLSELLFCKIPPAREGPLTAFNQPLDRNEP